MNIKYRDLTQEFVRELLDYEPETGALKWRKARIGKGRPTPPGSRAGRYHKTKWGPRGYIGINGKLYLISRIIWLWWYGEWPDGVMDHIDGDPGNDRIDNLRVATNSQNSANAVGARDGLKGAYRDNRPGRKPWKSCITFNGKQKHLGAFDTEEDAHRAYCAAAEKYFGEFACSGIRDHRSARPSGVASADTAGN